MNVTRIDCGQRYDDARCLTFCPHEEFISEFDAEMHDLAIKLTNKPLRFAHEWESGPIYRIRSVGPTGMVTLDNLPGEFAPSLFVTTG